jgi:hypothetical protein
MIEPTIRSDGIIKFALGARNKTEQYNPRSSDPPFKSRTACFVVSADVALCLIRFYSHLLAGRRPAWLITGNCFPTIICFSKLEALIPAGFLISSCSRFASMSTVLTLSCYGMCDAFSMPSEEAANPKTPQQN